MNEYKTPEIQEINTCNLAPEIEELENSSAHCGTSTSSGLSMEFFVTISNNSWA